jgi:hypothetical protein
MIDAFKKQRVLTYFWDLTGLGSVGQWIIGLDKDNAGWKNTPVRSLNSPTG